MVCVTSDINQRNEMMNTLVDGNYTISKEVSSKAFRLFLSSTFADLIAERNKLQESGGVFERLRKYCQDRGFVFQVVDLRWGVSLEAGHDHRTLDICLNQVKHCKKFLNPHFAIMLSERYGWIPLPSQINQTELDAILKYASELERQDILKWYKLNTNTNHYLLAVIDKDNSQYNIISWEYDEGNIRDVIQKILKNHQEYLINELGHDVYQKYFQSATHQEIIDGLFHNESISRKNIHFFHRKIFTNQTDADKLSLSDIANYTDIYKDGNVSKLDNAKIQATKELINEINQHFKNDGLYDSNVHTYDLKLDVTQKIIKAQIESYKINDITYLDKICEDLYESTKKAIDQEIAEYQKVEAQEFELAIQQNFLENKTKLFIERAELEKFDEYINKTKENETERYLPRILVGDSGNGKSSLMAKAIKNAQNSGVKVFYRFVGISDKSSSEYDLAQSLYLELSDYCNKSNIVIQYNLDGDTVEFLERSTQGLGKLIRQLLSMVAEKQQIALFIDALDQFTLKANLEFIPVNIHKNLSIIVSTLPDSQNYTYEKDFKLRILKGQQDSCFIHLGKLYSHEITKFYDEFNIQQNPSIIYRDNTQKIRITQGDSVSPLAMKIRLEETKSIASYDNIDEIVSSDLYSDDIDKIIQFYFSSLHTRYYHDKNLASLLLGIIASSRVGLNENDLIAIASKILLSNDNNNRYFKESQAFRKAMFNEVGNTIPDAIWLRFIADLEPYITERSVNGITKISLFHRRFITAAKEYNHTFKAYEILIDYFVDKLEITTNDVLKLDIYCELVHLYLHNQQFSEASSLLMKSEFIRLLAQTDELSQFVNEYHYAYNFYHDFIENKPEVKNFQKFKQLYSWIYNLESVLQNRPNEMSLWTALLQLAHDNNIAEIYGGSSVIHEDLLSVAHCLQTPINETSQPDILMSKLDDIRDIVSVMQLVLKNESDLWITYVMLITAGGLVYLNSVLLENDQLELVEYDLFDGESVLGAATISKTEILAWTRNKVSSFVIDEKTHQFSAIKNKSFDEIQDVIVLNAIQVVVTTSEVIYLHTGKHLTEIFRHEFDENSFLEIKNILFYSGFGLYSDGVVRDTSNIVKLKLQFISNWYQSQHDARVILGWQSNKIFLLDNASYEPKQIWYDKHNSKILEIYALRNSCYLSLSEDGELHYWSKNKNEEFGVCKGIIRSFYFFDLSGIIELDNQTIVLWNRRGNTFILDLKEDFFVVPDKSTSVTRIANKWFGKFSSSAYYETEGVVYSYDFTTHNEQKFCSELPIFDDVAQYQESDCYTKYFTEWCQRNKFDVDRKSRLILNDETFICTNKKSSQLLYVKYRYVLNSSGYVLSNVWLSSSDIQEIFAADSEYVLIKTGSRVNKIETQQSYPIENINEISEHIYHAKNIIELSTDKNFIALLRNKNELLNKVDDYGFTPLFYAFKHNNLNLLQLLITNKADLSQTVKDDTPLTFAIRNNKQELVELLLNNNVNVTHPDRFGATPLNLSIKFGDIAIVKLLLDKLFLEHGSVYLNDALIVAGEFGHLEIVKLLLSRGAAVNAINHTYGATALMYAALNDRLLVAEFLLSCGADINHKAINGGTALIIASQNGHDSIVKLLLSHGVDAHVKCNDGGTALTYAAENGFLSIVEMLLAYGVDINACNNNNSTSLMFAAFQGYLNIVNTLIAHGASVNLDDGDGWTALIFAVCGGNIDIINSLLANDADTEIPIRNGWTPLLLSANRGHLEVAKLLLDAGTDINVKDSDNCTALMLATFNNHLPIVELLLMRGADTNIQNRVGGTALSFATQSGYVPIVELLLEAGADTNIKCNEGRLAIEEANDRADILDLFLAHEAKNVQVINKNIEFDN